ncbi:hypothetical protein [Paenibacillus sp. FSL R10-2734]|uniref:hypothetical protein n=1 Tax=Paenibacillus sp. FSL R10-2734 TaxID=2954691 RepID=UPI0030D829A9
MRNKGTDWPSTYEPFHIMLNDYRVADIVITNHAKSRYLDRINKGVNNDEEVAAWMWQCLMQNRLKPFSDSDFNAYLIDDDAVVIAEFTELTGEKDISGQPLYAMIIVSFLGRISETPQLRDLKTYFSMLRISRRTKLTKKKRKRK